MAFVRKITLDEGVVGIWELSEDAVSLADKFIFWGSEKKEFENIKAGRRKKEYLAVRLLLLELLGTKVKISYDDYGRPAIKGSGLNLSISHSNDLAVVFISPLKIGIDVEGSERKIEKVASRFLHESEKSFISTCMDRQKTTILLWCAKEAIYKCSEIQGIDFSKEIIISPFSAEQGTAFTGRTVCGGKSIFYRLKYFDFKNNLVVFCVEKEIGTN